MIHANELRIGNWLQDVIELEKVLPVYKIEPGIITCGNEDFTYPYLAETLKPIPLTPDILEKCGFEKCTCAGYRLEREGLPLFHINKDLSFDSWGHIKSLHQLQNLYYCLTGTELTIEL